MSGIGKCLGVRTILAGLVWGLICFPVPSFAAALPVQSTISGLDTRLITLGEIGFGSGAQLSSQSPRADLYFPVPQEPQIRSLHLHLPWSATGTTGSRRSLQLLAGDSVLSTAALAPDAATGVLDTDLPLAAVQNGQLHVAVIYTSTAIGDGAGAGIANRCFDGVFAGDNLLFAAAGGISVNADPGNPPTISAVIAMMPPGFIVQAPRNASEVQAAAALTLAAADSNASITFEPPAMDAPIRGLIVIAGPGGPAIQAVPRTGAPELILGGPNPLLAARAVNSSWNVLLRVPQVAQIDTAAPAPADRLSFADLNADPREINIGTAGGWTVGLSMSQIPAGRMVTGLDIEVALAADPVPTRPVISVWVNGVLLASAPAAATGTTRLHADVPKGLIGGRNGIEVRVSRQYRERCGDLPQTIAAQLSGASQVLLGPASPVASFYDFAPLFHSGVTVVMRGPADLPLAAKAVAGLAQRDAVISVSYGKLPADGPVLLIGQTAPPGTRPRVEFGASGISVAGDSGKSPMVLPAAGAVTIAQMLEADGRPVLWLRPGASAAVPDQLWLDRGDVAFIGAAGVLLTLGANRNGASQNEAGIFSFRIWGIVALVIAVFALIFGAARFALHRRGRPGQ